MKLHDPVINGDGLVGQVTAVTGGISKVTLISDHSSAVAVRVVPAGIQGVVKPTVGEPNRLVLEFLDSDKRIHKGESVVTAGWHGDGIESRFPPNIPVGEVTHASIFEQEAQGRRSSSLRRTPQPRLAPGADGGKPQVILTPKIVARLVVVGLLGVLLQLTFFSQVELFHVSPDVLPALVVCLGLLGGTMTGAVSGFAIGFLLDCLLIQPLGGASLVLIAVGYAAGTFRERFEIHSRLVPPLLCAVLTLLAELGFGAVEAMFGIHTEVSALVLRDMLVKSVFAFFLGWAIYVGLRRLVRPALVDEATVRRTRRPTVLGA